MSCIKEWVLHEPVIDVIPKNAIITTEQVICEIDMYTVKVEDADFVSSYKLKVLDNNVYVHTIVTWFDAYFNESHRPI